MGIRVVFVVVVAFPPSLIIVYRACARAHPSALICIHAHVHRAPWADWLVGIAEANGVRLLYL